MANGQPEVNPYREIYQFAAGQISESRATFERYYKLTIGGLVLLATLTIGVFFWLVGKEYRDIAAGVRIRTDAETETLKQDIRKRIEDQFKTENMRVMIREVAVAQTKAGLSDVINRAVVETVERRVRAEEPQIHQAVVQETQKAVLAVQPSMKGEIKQRVDELSATIEARIAQTQELLRVANLSILARNGLGPAYDELVRLGNTTSNADIRAISTTTQNQVYLEMDVPFYTTKSFTTPKSVQELITLLENEQPLVRKAAIDDLTAKGEKAIVPKLLQIAEHDPYMVVRQAAFRALQVLSGQQIPPLQIQAWKSWWDQNKGNWPPPK